MNNFILLLIKGVIVGVANIIPGVSGGTIAVVMGIFDQLIDSINSLFKTPKKALKFLLPIFIGAGAGIVLFSKILKFGLENYSFITTMFFVGLVIGSIPVIYSNAKRKKLNIANYAAILVSFALIVLISIMKEPQTELNQGLSTIFLVKIFGGGVIASASMVIPGISGSFVLVLLGLYNLILNSISDFVDSIGAAVSILSTSGFSESVKYFFTTDAFVILLVAGLGIILGILLISKVIAYLFEKAYSMTYCVILGLIFGSLFSIFADPNTYASGMKVIDIVLGIVTLAVGFVVSANLKEG